MKKPSGNTALATIRVKKRKRLPEQVVEQRHHHREDHRRHGQRHHQEREPVAAPGQMTRFLQDVDRYASQEQVNQQSERPVVKVKNDVQVELKKMLGNKVRTREITNPLIEYPKGRYFELEPNTPNDDDKTVKKNRHVMSIPYPRMDSPEVREAEGGLFDVFDHGFQNLSYSPEMQETRKRRRSEASLIRPVTEDREWNDPWMQELELQPREPSKNEVLGDPFANLVINQEDKKRSKVDDFFFVDEKKGDLEDIESDSDSEDDKTVSEEEGNDSDAETLKGIFGQIMEDRDKLKHIIPPENDVTTRSICQKLSDIALKNGVDIDAAVKEIQDRKKKEKMKKKQENRNLEKQSMVFPDFDDDRQLPLFL